MKRLLSLSYFARAMIRSLREGIGTMVEQKRWRLLPAFLLFLLLAVLLAAVKAVAPLAPFVYSLL